MRKTTFATQSHFQEWFSIQILVTFEIFKLTFNISLIITGLKSPSFTNTVNLFSMDFSLSNVLLFLLKEKREKREGKLWSPQDSPLS